MAGSTPGHPGHSEHAMRTVLALTAIAALALSACDDMGVSAGLPQAAALEGNTLTLSWGGSTCRVTPPDGTALSAPFSVVRPPGCPGVVEVGVARLTNPDVHVVQIVPASLAPLALSGQAPGIARTEVTVMVAGGAIAGFVGGP